MTEFNLVLYVSASFLMQRQVACVRAAGTCGSESPGPQRDVGRGRMVQALPPLPSLPKQSARVSCLLCQCLQHVESARRIRLHALLR